MSMLLIPFARRSFSETMKQTRTEYTATLLIRIRNQYHSESCHLPVRVASPVIPALHSSFVSFSLPSSSCGNSSTARTNARTYTTSATEVARSFQTSTSQGNHLNANKNLDKHGIDPVSKPGSAAFADSELHAVADLFHDFAIKNRTDNENDDEKTYETYLDIDAVRELLNSIGERPDDATLRKMFDSVDTNRDGKIGLNSFLMAADNILGGSPARIVLVVGGPGSGKGMLCDRLAAECNVVHLSSGDLLREEVESDTPLGRECASIMARGELVSSAAIVTLVRRRMRAHPGKRVLLDGFPRSLENATDLMDLVGIPEVALHLECDDTILMERIIKRGRNADAAGEKRADDDIDTALKRLRVYHKSHHITLDWLRGQHVPIVNLDCSGTPENVWQQLLAIGRLMRPVAQVGSTSSSSTQSTPRTNGSSENESSAPAFFG